MVNTLVSSINIAVYERLRCWKSKTPVLNEHFMHFITDSLDGGTFC